MPRPGHLMSSFSTHDLSLAATLLFEKCYLLDVDRSSSQVEFIFEDSEQIREIVTRYLRDQLPYPVHGLFAAYKRAKKILHDTRA